MSDDFLSFDEKVSILKKVLLEKGVEVDGLSELLAETQYPEVRRSNTFSCPACQTALQFRMNVVVKSVVDPATGAEYKRSVDLAKKLSEAQDSRLESNELLQFLKDTKLFDAFLDAWKQLPASHIRPKNLERHMLTFLELAVETSIPSHVKRKLQSELNAARLSVLSHGVMSAVVADGVVKMFAPSSLMRGESLGTIKVAGGELTATSDTRSLSYWVRTKYGYVEGRGALWEELRRKSKGDFAKACS
jgi:hypothetical protein